MRAKVFPLIMIGIFLTVCNAKAFEPNKIQKRNVAIAKKVFEYFNKHDWHKMAGLYSDPAEFLDPSFGQQPAKRTRQQTIQKYAELQSMSKDIHDDIVAVYVSGEKNVIVEFVSSGTAPDGTKWSLPICTIFTIEKGQITADRTYYDNPSKKRPKLVVL